MGCVTWKYFVVFRSVRLFSLKTVAELWWENSAPHEGTRRLQIQEIQKLVIMRYENFDSGESHSAELWDDLRMAKDNYNSNRAVSVHQVDCSSSDC